MSIPKKRGRPRTFNRDDLRARMEEYTASHDIPILAEFAAENGFYRQQLYEIPEISDAIKRLITKKEANLEKKGLENSVNTTMAIFSLKQLGWTDKTEVEHSGSLNVVQLTPAERDARIAELLGRHGA